MLPTPKPTAPPKIETLEVQNWLGGIQTALDDGRTPSDGLRSGANIMLDQDGTVRPRYSLALYGPQPTGTVLGEVFSFRAISGLTFTNWMISLQNVSGTTNVYICKGGDATWTKISAGTTFDNSAKAHFCQVQNKVLIMNGVNPLSYYDILANTVTSFSAILSPTSLAVINNGSSDLTSGTKPFTLYYTVTANSSVGETAAPTPISIAVNTDRDFWIAATQSLKITWSAVTGAKSYNVYAGIAASGAGAPTLYALNTGISADTTTFIDDGSWAYQLVNVAPSTNSTAGPKVTRGSVINGRPFLVGDFDHPDYVWNGGDPGFELDFTYTHGGGFSQVGNGTTEIPTVVKSFHEGKGDPGIFVLTQGTSGHGKRYFLTSDSITYGGITIPFYDVTEDNGTDGTNSPDGVIVANDALWYPSTDGFKTTGTKPQLQNILSTDRVSNTIQTDITNLNNSAMMNCVGLAYQGRLFWALPFSATTNNQIWVLDLDRKGAWMNPWNISADWMWLYDDNNGVTHFLIMQNNVISEFTDASYTNDDSVAFPTGGSSGQISFSKDGRQWAHLINVIYVLLRPQGTFQASVTGEGDSGISEVGADTFTPLTSVAGWDEPTWSWDGLQRPWDAIGNVPQSFNSATQEVKVVVDEDLKWFSYAWDTSDFGVHYSLSKIVAEFVIIGIKDI